MILHLLVGLAGIGLAALGGRLFVGGAVGIAAASRIPPGVVGATVAAFATSGPELAVALNAAASGSPALSLGDALGSNVVNVALVLGLALAIAPLRADRRDLVRDVPLAVAAPLVIGLMLIDGRLSRTDGAILLAIFFSWLAVAVGQALRQRDAAVTVLAEHPARRAALDTALGLVLLATAGRLVVAAGRGLGHELGLDEFVVGATLVAFGTSTPELATVIVSRAQKHDEVGVGTVLGSNIFNALWIVGLVALLRPFEVSGGDVVVGVLASSIVPLALLPLGASALGRARGVALLAAYTGYVTLLLAARPEA